ncbi:MAG: succinyldiaminopimelate transaminase [Porticoccus sp.]|nr:succinyldiaminopimelate transaminase [Porticoccus sp.]
MNTDLDKLHPYPFEKLTALKLGINPPTELTHIPLSIGEPKHSSPHFVTEALTASLAMLSAYPLTKGTPEFRQAVSNWLTTRFQLQTLDPETQVLPVNGTREALFAFAQAVVDRPTVNSPNDAFVLSPNPFYQIYEGAALLSGAKPYFLNCLADTHFLPNFDSVPSEVWEQCQLIYICTPGNPTGAVLDIATLQKLIKLADQYDFVIASDECYSEIYGNEDNPPPGLLEACEKMQRRNYQRCVVFHSLSKRSNLPGLRSGFVAGDAEILKSFLRYRTYHGSAMPVTTQLASIAAWNDEEHVKDNRDKYRQKFKIFQQILGEVLPLTMPDAGFYLWANILPANKGNEEIFARELFAQQNVTVLPGSYLGRSANGINPGHNYVRMALVAPLDECREAAERIKQFVLSSE